MKKITFLTTLTASVLLFNGCDKDDNTPTSNLPTVPSVGVDAGSLDTYENMDNAEVTGEDLDVFFDLIGNAFGNATTTATADIDSNQNTFDITDTVDGIASGYMIVNAKGKMSESMASASITMTAFDFSDDNSIYLGGAIGAAFYMTENLVEIKVDGYFEFAGDFEGDIDLDCSVKANPNSDDINLTGTVILTTGDDDVEFDLTSDIITKIDM